MKAACVVATFRAPDCRYLRANNLYKDMGFLLCSPQLRAEWILNNTSVAYPDSEVRSS